MTITHIGTIKDGSALVVDFQNHGPGRQVETYQALCTCGYKGPRRTNHWEAEDDLDNHSKYPQEG